MFTKLLLPLLAVVGLGFAVYATHEGRKPTEPSRPLVEPPVAPRAFRAIAGAGLIEPQRENIPVGTHEPGVVTKVFVAVDQKDPATGAIRKTFVKPGDPLFQLDTRQAEAELKVREAQLAAAEATLHKLQSAPRPEDVPPAEATFAEMQARFHDAETNYDRTARLRQQNAVTASEYDIARFNFAATRAAMEKARADLDRLKKGTWEADLLVARADVEQARAQVFAARTSLDRLTVRAPDLGDQMQVLQVNVRPGQFAALAWKEPLIVLGDVTHLRVRVDIDEQDVPLFQEGTAAVATLKGRPGVPFPLTYKRTEPYVIPKKSLTGDNSERVDTRVLQVLYELPDDRVLPLFVGQQMDVYIEKAPPPSGVDLGADPDAPKPFEDRPARPARRSPATS
jgi:multidrug resistance efflux pump